ncbi:MAG: hypothetical protein LC775_10695 [Acidobacteria bacterium]|nr:hypothetical protein [Acidobacteriota bacterium]
MGALGLQSGHYRALHRPEALCFGAFWRLGRARAIGRYSGRCSGGQTEINEILITGGCSMAAMIFKVPLHLGALLDVDLEH